LSLSVASVDAALGLLLKAELNEYIVYFFTLSKCRIRKKHELGLEKNNP
jgi:hypothetical protein